MHRTKPWATRIGLCIALALLGLAFSQADAKEELLIFGGSSHDVFLGCLTCNQFSSDSVLNEFGTYGSSYSAKSIWNEYGQYGGSYGMYSPCNPYASNPPVVVDRSGGFYGYLTVNEFHRQRITSPSILEWLETQVCN